MVPRNTKVLGNYVINPLVTASVSSIVHIDSGDGVFNARLLSRQRDGHLVGIRIPGVVTTLAETMNVSEFGEQ